MAHDDLAATLADLLHQALHLPVRAKRMFGGHGFYADDLFIAVLIDGMFHLKTTADTRAAFEGQGLLPWVYHREGKPVTMGFHPVPESALEDPEMLRPWARLALQAALSARHDRTTPGKRPNPRRNT